MTGRMYRTTFLLSSTQREAIANAIIHRDYSVRGTSLMVEVYDDRVEIVNPGVFPQHRKKEFGKISVRRNEHIADLFFRMDKVERAGTGIRRMKEAMTVAGLAAPNIRQTGFYTIVFKRPVESEVKKDVEHITQETTQKSWVKRLGEKLGEKLGENEQKILENIAENKFVTIPELSDMLGISTTAVENNLAKLKSKKVIKRIGPDKGGHWEIVKN